MSISRRKFLALAGGGVVLAAAIPSTLFLTTRTPEKALLPWDEAGAYKDPRLRALSFGLLAPNPHNRQPWIAELVGDDGVVIHRDPDRNLPATDPFARQLTIGMGCFLELMEMAAGEAGYQVETILFPRGEDGPVAECRFVSQAGTPNPLFKHVLNRRSYKGVFEDRVVDTTASAPLQDHAQLFLEGSKRDQLKKLAIDAWQAEAADPAAWQESVDLLRIGKKEIEANPDGIDLGGPMMDSLALVGLMSREAAADPQNPGTRAAIEETTASIESASGMALIVTPDNQRTDQIRAGRDWLRLNLAATGAGLALRPVSQALQEYAAVRPFYDEIHRDFAPAGHTVQMLGLLGYGAIPPRTPRWRLETRIRNAG